MIGVFSTQYTKHYVFSTQYTKHYVFSTQYTKHYVFSTQYTKHYVFSTQYTKHYVFILLNQYHTLWPKRWFMVFNATFNSISVIFLADLAKGNVSYCHQLVLRPCRPSVNFSYFNCLLWNPSAKWTETW